MSVCLFHFPLSCDLLCFDPGAPQLLWPFCTSTTHPSAWKERPQFILPLARIFCSYYCSSGHYSRVPSGGGSQPGTALTEPEMLTRGGGLSLPNPMALCTECCPLPPHSPGILASPVCPSWASFLLPLVNVGISGVQPTPPLCVCTGDYIDSSWQWCPHRSSCVSLSSDQIPLQR